MKSSTFFARRRRMNPIRTLTRRTGEQGVRDSGG